MNRAYIVALLAALAVIAILALQKGLPTISDDPAPSTVGSSNEMGVEKRESQSVSEGPQFVGRQVCRECHAENFNLHAVHGHAHTFTSASDPEVVDKFIGRTYEAEGYGKYAYHANSEGLFAQIPEKFGDRDFPLEYALGSGHNAITLISLIASDDRETVAIEHRASWFRDGDRLGLTPGQRDGPPKTATECFGVMHRGNVMRRCVDCHTTTGTIVDQKIVGLTANVNCEKCHGPGSEHVAQARQSRTPPPFSVGLDEWDTESEIQLCGNCHRLPHTMPQKELREYPDTATRFQPVGLLRSKCFVESAGKLKCTTCHNPHTSVHAVPTSDHIQNCVKCHLEDSADHVACPVSPATGCVECHMPKIEVAGLGAGFHDHWIRVHPDL